MATDKPHGRLLKRNIGSTAAITISTDAKG
jgi:hypothetical protein